MFYFHAIILCEQVCEKSEGVVTFEPMQNSNPPVDEVRALEQLSLHPKCEVKICRQIICLDTNNIRVYFLSRCKSECN